MFGKTKNAENIKMDTVIGPDTHFKGTVRSKGYVRVDGHVEGGISAEGVIVGGSGHVQGDISVKNAVVGGRVNGNIEASESLELQPSCHVHGDLRAGHLAISDGAVFEGSCVMMGEKDKREDSASLVKTAAVLNH